MLIISLFDNLGEIQTVENQQRIIKELPVKIYLNYQVSNNDDEVIFDITLLTPDQQLASKQIGFLDASTPEYSSLLPLRGKEGEWVIQIEIAGNVQQKEIFRLYLAKKVAETTWIKKRQ